MCTFNTDFYYHVDVKEFTGHKDEVNCVAFSPDFAILVTGSDDERVRVFNAQTGCMVVRLKGQTGSIRCVAISPDSAFIASGSYDKSVVIYRTCDASTVHRLTGHLKSVESVRFSDASSQLCSTSWDRTAILWDVESGCMLRLFQGHSSLVQCAAFSRCNRMLATGSWDHTVRVWPLSRRAGKHMHVLSTHTSNVHAVQFSCHNILATAGWDKLVLLWNPYTAEPLFTLRGHEGWVQALCFSPDGYLLASSADDDMVKIWSVADGVCLKTLEGKTESVAHCGFHLTGALIVSGASTPALGLLHPTPGVDGGGQPAGPPLVLDGEEILVAEETDLKQKPRAQSARPLRTGIDAPGADTQAWRTAPKSAGPSRRVQMCPDTPESDWTRAEESKPAVLEERTPPARVTVEKWLSVSFQRL